MKLLFDANLSPSLVRELASIYPSSLHVFDRGPNNAPDQSIWEWSKENGFTIVTKDSDFQELCASRGIPPKIIWLRCGNCSTRAIRDLILKRQAEIREFESNDARCLILF